MIPAYSSPQDTEDAFYDALEDGDIGRLLSVWADSDDISCLLPMSPLVRGRSDVEGMFARLFARGHGIALSIEHLGWIQTDDIAIHQVVETVQDPAPGNQPPVSVYGTNIYRKDASGWRLIVHQNAPTPAQPPRSP